MFKWMESLAALFRPKEPIIIPTKTGQDVVACFSVLNLSGSAFCLDNKNILFKDEKGNAKVLKPFYTVGADEEAPDFSVKETPDGFFVRYGEDEYFYLASFKATMLGDTKIFKIVNVKQHVYSITTDESTIKVNPDYDGYPDQTQGSVSL